MRLLLVRFQPLQPSQEVIEEASANLFLYSLWESTIAGLTKFYSAAFTIRIHMDDDDDRNKLCDMLTQLVVSAMPADDKHNSDKLRKLCQFVFRDTDLPVKVAALLLMAKQ